MRLLGSVAAYRDSRPVNVGGPKQRGVLALLALAEGRSVPFEDLVAGLWAENPPETAVPTIAAYISRLRAALGRDVIAGNRNGYQLSPDEADVDVWRFERAVAAGRASHSPAASSAHLMRAMDLWRGRPLADLESLPFVPGAVARLDAARLAGLEALVDARMALDQWRELDVFLHGLVEEYPLHERFAVQWMIVLDRLGRRAQALEVYQDLRDRLVAELGIDPGNDAAAVHQHVLRGDLAATEVGGSPAGRAGPRPSNVWVPPTPLLGRDDVVARIVEHLSSSHVVVTGAPGVGKTRVALEVAHRTDLDDGPWLIDLGAVAADDGVPIAAADVLGIALRQGSQLRESVTGALADRTTLLLLDNCEHLPAGVARFIADITRGCPQVRVLATSREPLNLPDAATVALQGLPVPVVADDLTRLPSGQLLLDRMGLSGEQIGARDRELFTAACAKVQGNPLALELVAGAARNAALDETAGALAGLPTARTDAAETTLTWLVQGLPDAQCRLLARLSVFRRSFTASAAAAVGLADAAEDLRPLSALSLIVASGDAAAGPRRYRLASQLRAQAARDLANLGEQALTEERYAAWLVELAERAHDAARTIDATTWFAELDEALPDLRAAAAMSLERRPLLALRLVAALAWYRFRRGQIAEGIRDGEAAIAAAPDAPPALIARAHAGTASLAYLAGDVARLTQHIDCAMAGARTTDPQTYATIFYYSAWQRMLTGDLDAALRSLDKASGAHAVPLWLRAELLMTRGVLQRFAGELDRAETTLDEAEELADRAGHRWAAESSRWLAGKVAFQKGDLAAAARRYRRNLIDVVADGDTPGTLVNVLGLAAVAAARRDAASAGQLADSVRRFSRRLAFEPEGMDPVDAPAYLALVEQVAQATPATALSWEEMIRLGQDVAEAAAGPV